MSWSVDIQVKRGPFVLDVAMTGDASPVAIIGPNGAGKTTLLRAIAGAYRPMRGQISVAGRALFDAAQAIDVPPEQRQIGYVPQGYGLFPHLKAIDNVAFGWQPQPDEAGHRPRLSRNAARSQARKAAQALLDELGCGDLASRMPRALSGGEKQRVALARALMIEPQLLLLDEPLSALDPPSRRALRGFLAARLQAQGKPAIIVTHDMNDVLALCPTAYVIEGGQVTQHGPVETLLQEPATAFVEEFFYVDPRLRAALQD